MGEQTFFLLLFFPAHELLILVAFQNLLFLP